MGDVEKLRAELRRQLPALSERYGVVSLGLFGSYVRGEQHPDSDLDVLVELRQPLSLLRMIALQHELSDLLDMDVDLVPKQSLKPIIGKRILAEVVPV